MRYLTRYLTIMLLINQQTYSSFIKYKNIGNLIVHQEPYKTYVGKSRVFIDSYTYASKDILNNIKEFGHGSSLYIGKFCIIADTVQFELESNSRTQRITSYPLQDIDEENFLIESP